MIWSYIWILDIVVSKGYFELKVRAWGKKTKVILVAFKSYVHPDFICHES